MIPLHEDVKTMLSECAKNRNLGGMFILPEIAKRYEHNHSEIQHEIAHTLDWTFGDKKMKNWRPPKTGRYDAHSFRHTFASFLINAGVNPEVIMKLLGQTSLAITRIYTHLSFDTAKSIIAALPH